ncbi:MAG: ABC transporter substrate-binding protein, partial [Candidatus Kariarchaeaceae archaeon]
NPTTYTARQITVGNYYPSYGSFYPTLTRADAGTTLVYAASAGPINLNPVQYADSGSSNAFSHCLDGMYTYDYDFNVVPQLASDDPIISEDSLTWTVPLRDDIFWQDGEQFDAYDVYFSVMAYTNPKNPELFGLAGDTSSIRATNWGAIFDIGEGVFTGNVTIIDDFTVQFKMAQVYAPFATKNLMTSIIPEHLLNVTDVNSDGKISDEATWQNYSNGSHFIGTGAYYFSANDWTHETQYMNRLRTDVNNPYWPTGDIANTSNIPFDLTWTDEDTYQIEQVITRTIPQMAAQITEFEAGGIDFVELFANPELIPTYETDSRFNVTATPSYTYDILIFNLEDPVFKSNLAKGKDLRKAIAYATDRVSMVETIRGGRAVVCDNPISPANTFWYNWDNPVIYRFNINTALEYMGIRIPTTQTHTILPTITPFSDTTSDSDSALGIKLISTLIILNIAAITLKKKRKI